jgi:NADH:ubiquinone oxidoreductase subunit H
MPFSFSGFFSSIDLSLLFFFAVGSLGVYGIILSG